MKTIRISMLAMAVIASACGSSSPASPATTTTVVADTISSFGTGDSFATTSGSSFGMLTPTPSPIIWDYAVAFTPSASSTIQTIEVAAALSQTCLPTGANCTLGYGKTQFVVTVYTDTAGVPGTAVESITVDGALSSTAKVVTVNSVTHPRLTASAKYWLALSVLNPASADLDRWSDSSPVLSGTIAIRQGGTWSSRADTRPAFRIKFGA